MKLVGVLLIIAAFLAMVSAAINSTAIYPPIDPVVVTNAVTTVITKAAIISAVSPTSTSEVTTVITESVVVPAVTSAVTPVITTFVTEISTVTETTLPPPLPSSEAEKQQAEFTKAQAEPAPIANKVVEVFSAQGIVVPSALVPAQPKQTEVKHSGLQDIVSLVNATDYNPDVKANPRDGFYIKFFNGTNTSVADAYAEEHKVYLPHTIVNPSEQGMCILGGAKNLATGKNTPFALNNTASPRLYLAPNSTVQVGNFIPEGLHQFNGRLQVQHGCDSHCKNCPGESQGPILTLYEFYHGHDANGERMYSDPSNVDGFNSNFNMTIFGEKGICRNRYCHATAKQVKDICPAANLWEEKGIYGCKSDCKVTGRNDHCCVGEFGTPETCPPSSQHLLQLCQDAYSYAYDDATHTDFCVDIKSVHLAFFPIA